MQDSTYKTEQEAFWAGEFGDEYTERNNNATVVAGNVALFQKALNQKDKPGSVIEFGANRGMNILALKTLLPESSFCGVDINPKAIDALKQIPNVEATQASILEYSSDKQYDLAFIKGVLIHINPDELASVYKTLYKASSKYILIAEYYNPSPVTIQYRGHQDRLFKRDFAGEMLDKYPDLKLVDYGFCYHRDVAFPLDDITWFLLEKKK